MAKVESNNFEVKIQKLRKLIDSNKSFAIFMHENPDGDTIGSGLAFGYFLEKLGKTVGYFCPSKISRKFYYLKEVNKIKQEFDFSDSRDILVFLDVGSLSKQLSTFWLKNEKYFLSKFKVVIDHHVENDGIGDLILRKEVSSTCFLVGDIFKKIGFKIDENIANFLILGHLTDTNFCMWPSITLGDFQFVIDLIKSGGDKQAVVDNIYYNFKFSSIKLIGKIIERANFQNGIVRSYYTDEDLDFFGADREDVDFVMDLLRRTSEGKVFLLFRKHDNILKVSIRTKKPIASDIAKFFGGGGHKYAAGFKKILGKELEKEIGNIIDVIYEKFGSAI